MGCGIILERVRKRGIDHGYRGFVLVSLRDDRFGDGLPALS